MMSEPTQKLRVLIVDDDLAVGTTLQRLLRATGHEVTVFIDPVSALEHCRAELVRDQQTPPYDLVFSDYNMPAMNGLTFLRLMRAEVGRNSVLVLMSGGADQQLAHTQASSAAYVDHFLPKPWSEAALQQYVAVAIARVLQRQAG